MQAIYAGCLPYQAAWDLQRRLVAERSGGRCDDTLLLLEHPPTITLGNRARPEHVLLAPSDLERRGIALVASDRGGDVTYHAPGQLVGYPILKLSRHGGDLGRYMRNLEEVIIRILASYGIAGRRVAGLTGVWVDAEGVEEKVCAIGVKLSASGVTSHGFALNISPDLGGFAQIVPCGISGRGVTSLERLLGYAPPRTEVEERAIAAFAEVFEVAIIDGGRWMVDGGEALVSTVHHLPSR